MRASYNLIYNINEMYLSIEDKQNSQQIIDMTIEKLELIDKDLIDIYEILCVDNQNVNMFNKLLLKEKIMSSEEKLLNTIFGISKPKTYSLRKEFNKISSSIIRRDNM